MSFGRYLLASELVMIPMNAVLILGGNALYQAVVHGEVSWLLVGLSTAAALIVLAVGHLGRRVLGTRPEGQAGGEPAGGR